MITKISAEQKIKKLEEEMAAAKVELEIAQQNSPAQDLALEMHKQFHRCNSMECGFIWENYHYNEQIKNATEEGQLESSVKKPWVTGSEHKRWLAKAEKAISLFPEKRNVEIIEFLIEVKELVSGY